MIADEQIILQTYLLRIAAISSEDEFEEWYRQRHESKEAEAEYKAVLDLANAYALGLRDAKLQAEAWVEGIDRTYNLIIEKLIAHFDLADRPAAEAGIANWRRWREGQ